MTRCAAEAYECSGCIRHPEGDAGIKSWRAITIMNVQHGLGRDDTKQRLDMAALRCFMSPM